MSILLKGEPVRDGSALLFLIWYKFIAPYTGCALQIMNSSGSSCRLYFPLQRYCGKGTPSTAMLNSFANGLVDLTTTFRNFHQVLIGYFINPSAIYLSYPSVSTVSWLHVKFRSRQESR